MTRSLPVVALVFLASGAIQGQVPQSRIIRVEEMPFGNKVNISEDSQGRAVIEMTFGSLLRSSVWTVAQISVCWENPADSEAEDRSIVQKAVAETWQRESRISFVGWQTCATDALGIHIRVDDSAPHTTSLGRYLDGKPSGLLLNFTFRDWSERCQANLKLCKWAIAVHEFGHALGFTHEQNRYDAPVECQLDSQGTTGNWNVTSYDPESVMNYCNKQWNNAGKLSARDVAAVRTVYGSPQ